MTDPLFQRLTSIGAQAIAAPYDECVHEDPAPLVRAILSAVLRAMPDAVPELPVLGECCTKKYPCPYHEGWFDGQEAALLACAEAAGGPMCQAAGGTMCQDT